MEKLNIFYSVLQYMPDIIRQEVLNIGIVIHIPSEKYSKFYEIKRKERLRSFDDEYDNDYMSMMFKAFHFEFDSDAIDNKGFSIQFENIESSTFLERRTIRYSNEFRFLPVKALEISKSERDETEKSLVRTYLYYDVPKNTRITTKEVQKTLRKQFRYSKIKINNDDNKIVSNIGQKKVFDFVINNTLIKAQSFDYKQSNDLIKELKSTLYDINTLSSELENKKIRYIITDQSNEANIDILNEFETSISSIPELNISIELLSNFTEELQTRGIA